MSTALNPITVRVRCSGRLHRLTWHRGRLIAKDHGPHNLRLGALLDAPTRCGTILAAAGSETLPLAPIIPRALRRAIRAHRAAQARTRVSWVNSSRAVIRIAPANGPLEARGRNGWFTPIEALVESLHYAAARPDPTSVGIASSSPYHNAPPIYLRGPRTALLRLFRQITRALAQLRS